MNVAGSRRPSGRTAPPDGSGRAKAAAAARATSSGFRLREKQELPLGRGGSSSLRRAVWKQGHGRANGPPRADLGGREPEQGNRCGEAQHPRRELATRVFGNMNSGLRWGRVAAVARPTVYLAPILNNSLF